MYRELVVLLAVVAVALASFSLEPLVPIPEKFQGEKGCYIEDLDIVLPFGDSAPDKGECLKYYCYEDYVMIVSCGIIGNVPPCRVIEEDLSKPYPDCCPKTVCP